VEDALGALETSLHAVSILEDDALAGRLLQASQQQLAWLYQDLLVPLESYLTGYQRLLIAPDGPLFRVPFHALYDGQAYTLDRFEVSYAPSARALRLCYEHDQQQSDQLHQALILGYARPGRLPQIEAEVRAVARALPCALILTGEQASLTRLKVEAGHCKVLHLASHGFFRHDNPFFSGLQLAGGEWLRALDLYGLPLHGALVTLSGCDTGRHRLFGGDLLGLGRGFLVAGASALVSSLWPVDDEATARLMVSFYAKLADGQTVAAALRAAQRALRDGQLAQGYAHPAFWAPFCLWGVPDFRLA
jgi:CHAT domain-containing protein